MNEKLLRVLEFNKILKSIEKYAKTDMAKNKILSIKPAADIELIEFELIKTYEAYQILLTSGSIPLADFESIDISVLKAQKGGILNIAEFYELKRFLKICMDILKYFADNATVKLNTPKISAIVSYIAADKEFLRELNKVFIDKDSIADNASSELMRIRREIKSTDAQIISVVNSVLGSAANKKYLSDIVPAMKNKRLTVPVRSEFKDFVKGVIHDISSTGATVFIEPEKAFYLNNKLNELYIKENLEIEKILSHYSASVAVMADDLLSSFDAAINLDAVFAKAQYASSINAIKPAVSYTCNTSLYSARHPLIDKNDVVPSDIIYNGNYFAIIITGPNTGGKTVALKTLGLLSVMTQSGILIPAKEYSSVRIFKKIFADIGDEQSIEQSLSTFSSHMVNIIEILSRADEDTLILIDEIGAGTDPQEGAALGMAIIDDIIEKRSTAFISTHYSELKKYALTKPGAINASVEFDMLTLKPTYKLSIGLPGESNAIKIAHRLGLGDTVLDKAKEYISSDDENFEEILKTIKEKQVQSEEYTRYAEIKMRKAETYYNNAKEEYSKTAGKKEQIINEAKAEAIRIISKARQESGALMNYLINLKKNSADIDLKGAQEQRTNLTEFEKELGIKDETHIDVKDSNVGQNLYPGDEVYIEQLNAFGIISRSAGEHKYEVTVGSMRLKFDSHNLKKIKKENKMHSISFKRQSKAVPMSIDVRGMDSIRALKEIDKYIDDAIIAGYSNIMIIHGKGEGILRKETLNYLKSNSLIRSYRQGAYNEGGTGVTIAELK